MTASGSRTIILLLGLAVCAVTAVRAQVADPRLTLVVEAPGPDATLVSAPLPADLADGAQHAWKAWARPNTDREEFVPAQVTAVGPWGAGGRPGPWAAFALAKDWPGQLPVRLLMNRDISDWLPDEPRFRWEDVGGERRQLLEGDRPVLAYVYAMVLPEGVPANFRRSCYVHPLYGLDGEVLSDDFPADHYHHRGLFWRWAHVKVGEQDFDQWAVAGAEARFEAWLAQEAGPVCAVLGARNGWYIGDRKIVDEEAWVRVWPTGEVGRALDVCLVLNATTDPVELRGREGKGYSGFGFRYAPREGPVVTTSGGVQPQDSDHQPFTWADESGRFAGAEQMAGVALFPDPGNPGAPNGWCLRHYGYIGVGWPGLGSYTLQAGRPLVLRYRVWVHRGDAEQGQVAHAYAAFAQPPVVAVETAAP